VATQVVQAGVFHSYSASVHVAFAPAPAGVPGLEAVREALSAAPWLRWADQEPLGPVDAAGAEEVLLGPLRPDGARPGAFWLWSVMDNLTRGGASNAVALAEALLG
jgi:aspartate-semialdehyde dehydrogenase